jgi:hypothetical protein
VVAKRALRRRRVAKAAAVHKMRADA